MINLCNVIVYGLAIFLMNILIFLQVILCNKGDIDAVFRLPLPNTQFAPQFSFYPSQGIVIPGGYQAIQVRTFTKFGPP